MGSPTTRTLGRSLLRFVTLSRRSACARPFSMNAGVSFRVVTKNLDGARHATWQVVPRGRSCKVLALSPKVAAKVSAGRLSVKGVRRPDPNPLDVRGLEGLLSLFSLHLLLMRWCQEVLPSLTLYPEGAVSWTCLAEGPSLMPMMAVGSAFGSFFLRCWVLPAPFLPLPASACCASCPPCLRLGLPSALVVVVFSPSCREVLLICDSAVEVHTVPSSSSVPVLFRPSNSTSDRCTVIGGQIRTQNWTAKFQQSVKATGGGGSINTHPGPSGRGRTQTGAGRQGKRQRG